MGYDVLLIASGARPTEPFPAATAFTGSLTDQERLHGIVQDVEDGYVKRLAFVIPSGSAWPLPLYELALMMGERADSMGVEPELHLVTPESAPLTLFGAEAAREVTAMLTEARVKLHTSAHADVIAPGKVRLAPSGKTIEVDRVVTLPRLVGPSIPGLPADANGFLPTDAHSRVVGVADVYAAGDVTAFPIKQGGIACQQADAAAADIAARAGADIVPEPFSPVLRGMLVTERSARYMRRDTDNEHETQVAGRALWWPPSKIAGRELAGYLQGLDESTQRPAGRPVNVDVGYAGTGEIEVLSLQ
jgi:sulfide:quinone oxidoreductase